MDAGTQTFERSDSAHDRAAFDGPGEQFATFTIGSEEYGVDITAVREIKGWTPTTNLPNAPAHMRGVINLRGTIVPIFDLRARFGGGETEVTSRHVIVVVRIETRTVGILVDAVSDILTLGSEEIKPVPEVDCGIDASFLTGLVNVEERMVALLDLELLFGAEDLGEELEDAASAAVPSD
jgi:purine-binding chemotaxis protein CheW